MKVFQTINNVQKALTKKGISKDSTNSFDKYKFRGIDDVYNTLAPILAECGLCILPRILSREVVERQSAKGGAMYYVSVDAEFDLVDAEDGSMHTIKAYGEAMDRSDKATNKAMTAAYKYVCFMAFCIPIEGNDADAETPQAEYQNVTPIAQSISDAQFALLERELVLRDVDVNAMLAAVGVSEIKDIPQSSFDRVMKTISEKPTKQGATA